MAPPKKKTTKNDDKAEVIEQKATETLTNDNKTTDTQESNEKTTEQQNSVTETKKSEETKKASENNTKEECKKASENVGETKDAETPGWGDEETAPVGDKIDPSALAGKYDQEVQQKRVKYEDNPRETYDRQGGYNRGGYERRDYSYNKDSGFNRSPPRDFGSSPRYGARDGGYPPREGGRDFGYPPREGGRDFGYPPREGGRSSSCPPREGGRDFGYPPREGGRSSSYPPRESRIPRRDDEPVPPSAVLGIFGLRHAQESDIKEFLDEHISSIPYGDIKNILDRETRQPRGFAFVYFESIEDATKAKELLEGKTLRGNTIRIDFSKQDNRNRERTSGAQELIN